MDSGLNHNPICWEQHTLHSEIVGGFIEIIFCAPTARRILLIEELQDMTAFEENFSWNVRVLGLYKSHKVVFTINQLSMETASLIVLQLQKLQSQRMAL